MEEASMSRRKVRQWAHRSLLWWTTSTWSSLRSFPYRQYRPDPGCRRGMLMTLSASSGRAQPKNLSTISVGSGRPSSSLWTSKKTGKSHSSTHYCGQRTAAWMFLSTGSPHTWTSISLRVPSSRCGEMFPQHSRRDYQHARQPSEGS